jgi:hypothetical protein
MSPEPSKNWREYPALVEARRRLAHEEGARPGLIATARQAKIDVDTARAKDERADLDTLLGKASRAARDKAAAALQDARKADALAGDAVVACDSAISTLRKAIPELEREARASVWPEQKGDYLRQVEQVAAAAERLAELQATLQATRDALDREYWHDPPDDDAGIIRDQEGNAIGKIYDGPMGRTVFPDGTCPSILALGLAMKAIKPEAVERFKVFARSHGCHV